MNNDCSGLALSQLERWSGMSPLFVTGSQRSWLCCFAFTLILFLPLRVFFIIFFLPLAEILPIRTIFHLLGKRLSRKRSNKVLRTLHAHSGGHDLEIPGSQLRMAVMHQHTCHTHREKSLFSGTQPARHSLAMTAQIHITYRTSTFLLCARYSFSINIYKLDSGSMASYNMNLNVNTILINI